MAEDGELQKVQRAHYSPPWANTSIIGIAGSSGSGKTSLALAIIKQLSLPWVVILSMVGRHTKYSIVILTNSTLGLVLQALESRTVSKGLQKRVRLRLTRSN